MRLIVLAAVPLACGTQRPPAAPPPMPVPVSTVATADLVDSTEYLAQLRSRSAPAIRPQVDGQITAIFVKPGDLVEAGTPLLRIDPARQSAAVEQTRATEVARRAQLQLAERNLARVEQLVARGATTVQELDDARTAADAARADVAALAAQLRGSRVQLGYYQVTAPSRGVVGDIPVRIGDTVTTQTQLTLVADIRTLETNISIPVGRARDVQLGTEVRIVDDAARQIAVGHVSFIAPEVNRDSQSVLIKANIDNPDSRLRADQIVRARVVWRVEPGLSVPALAVTWMVGQPFVFVVDASGGRTVVRQRPVRLGELGDRSYPVLSGLKPGERIVTGGVQKLRDGAPVVAQATPAPAAPTTPAPGKG
ncbi:MAG TPA: efflux RND transporter periplasmic adaptor subunit [Kofleriaceae bacterium]|jgi:RND family efflux transporter MFP subunit|nr:efflux RND transporter periplasmic adaptor subunit [Kofleriaceae bacterium]